MFYYKIEWLFACIGALPIILRQWDSNKISSPIRKFSDVLISFMAAITISDWLTPESQPIVAMGLGLIAATIGSPALDSLYEIAPKAVKIYAIGLAKKHSSPSNTGYEDFKDTVPNENSHE